MMKTSIEVFKTNVQHRPAAAKLIKSLEALLWQAKVNFDLEDCDHILRVESAAQLDTEMITRFMRREGYDIATLPGSLVILNKK
ncbi:hypothetical protein [Niabella sp.]|uniref:hypothetical protein n=1 Tax=Niabella sp. TaxID=1962976 RepID=UPI0026357F42|nr:hypothetical protein [Niabella sp.]